MLTEQKVILMNQMLDFEAQLLDFYDKAEVVEHLGDATKYSLVAGGKRIRPRFLFETVKAFDKSITSDVANVAVALEMIHTGSLIHDDLPAMDNDDFRRGKPTNHKVYGEALAILAGDALFFDPFYILATLGDTSDTQKVALTKELAYASGAMGMVGGQVLDMDGEHKVLTYEELKQVHALKTGRLLTFPFVAGAILANGEVSTIEDLRQVGQAIGLAFQIRDDILDVTSDFESLGKTPGKDQAADKSTYVALLGLDGARSAFSKAMQDALDGLKAIKANNEQFDPTGLIQLIEGLRIG
jgi:geranylgeranyl diphosphate synthase type II